MEKVRQLIKLPKITFTAPWLKSALLNDLVGSWGYFLAIYNTSAFSEKLQQLMIKASDPTDMFLLPPSNSNLNLD